VSKPRARGRKKKPKTVGNEPASSAAPTNKGGSSSFAKWAALVALGAVVAAAGMFFVLYPGASGPGPGNAVEVDVGDETPESLAAKLEQAGVVGSRRWFALYLRLTGGVGSVAKGKHLLTDDVSPRELVHRLERQGASHVRAVIPEGWTRFDIAKRLDALHVCALRSFLDASEDSALLAEVHVQGPSAEGYLFPATYDLELDSGAADVVRRMVREFDKRYDALENKHQSGLRDLSESLGYNRREIVTLASMVEKEAAVDDERPIIASVFLNRLRDPEFTPKLLQCDPTAGYGCLIRPVGPCASYVGKVTHEILADAGNPYNTYKHERLPPGPIANPGARSLEAVMAPAITRYFYFVAKGGGRHTFSETLGGHNAAVHHE
jgi:UPF0755 protein